MKLLVFSDNHRNRESLKKMIADNPDAAYIISLGDSEMSETELTAMGIFGVKGNYPFEPKFPLELNLVFSGVRFLFVHGHEHGVKTGLSRLVDYAKSLMVDVVFYGHTHLMHIDEFHGLLLINPGALTFSRSSLGKTYAVVDVTDSELVVRIIAADTATIVKSIVKPLKSRRAK